jgi:thymidylate synthase (FAD)
MLKAKVVAYTQAVDSCLKDANELIAYIARVSNPDNQHNNLSAPKLISYLQRHKHWSPFEHYSLTIEIECPKDIAVQILRHRSFKFQEFSQRYADVTQMGFTTRECRLQDTKNRQNSIELDINDWSDRNLQQEWLVMQEQLLSYAKDYYQSALEMGIAKEQARALLPIGLTMSRLYMTGDIRSWLHYLAVRLDPTTQKEHRELAALIKDEVSKYFDLGDMFDEVQDG